MKNAVHYAIIGVCCGILLGLSLSPVLEKTLSIIITFVITLMGIVSGVKVMTESKNPKYQINPAPLSIMMIFLLLGVFSGIYMRTHNALGTDIADQNLSQKMKELKDSLRIVHNETGLRNDEQDIPCAQIKLLHGKELENELRKIGDKKVNNMLKVSTDSISLETIKAYACP
jgi:hypothetical protein